MLRPGGHAALTVWDSPDRARFIGVLLDSVAAVGAPARADLPPGPPIVRFSDDLWFERLLTSAGLTQPEVHRLEYRHSLATSDELWNCLVLGSVRLGALVVSQSARVQQQIRDEFSQNLLPYASRGELIFCRVSVKLGVGFKSSRKLRGPGPDEGFALVQRSQSADCQDRRRRDGAACRG